MIYVDTSVLVAALTKEEQTGRAFAFMMEQQTHGFATSAWVAAEFSAALSIKARNREMLVADRDRALDAFAGLTGASFRALRVSGTAFRAAARFADRYALGLRAGDALHLAIASEAGAAIATFDRVLERAAIELGVDAVRP